MLSSSSVRKIDVWLVGPVLFLVTESIVVLRSIAPEIFPQYFLYLILGMLAFFFFSKIDFSILQAFSSYLYLASIGLLVLTLIIGQVTRGAIRWIPIGNITIQPSEIIRPFLMIFFVKCLVIHPFKMRYFTKSLLLLLLPFFLILIQPSLGVAVLLLAGFLGVVISSDINKKALVLGLVLFLVLAPFSYRLLAPYQRVRIDTFLHPNQDPLGSGYNSIQSSISVGSGRLLGRGLGRGVQTQLAFLPEKHTDFVFAAISEELGFVGASLTLVAIFILIGRLIVLMDQVSSPYARSYLCGIVAVMLLQTVVNVGMNLGILPVAGLPLPLVSAGGSSYLTAAISLGIANGAQKS